MAVIRLVASSYGRSNTNYVTVTNPSYMYNNTDDSSNYATLRGRAGRSSTSTYYAFIKGFNFEDVPSAATVTGFRVLIKAYRGSYQATGNTSYRISLASQDSNSYKIGNTTLSEDITTSTSGEVYEFPTDSLTWTQLVGYGSNFSIDIPLRNSSTSSSNYPYVYVYGAEIEVTYSMPDPRTITSTLSGNGTISPSGANTYYDGDEYELTITPTNKADQVTATQDGVDITSQLVAHGAGSTLSFVPDDVTTSNISSGSSYAQYAVGNSAEDPSTSGTSSNMYSPSGSTGYAAYTFDFSSIPSNATIEELVVRCYGHRESSSIDSSHVSNVALYYGSTMKGEDVDFPSTSNTMVTIDNTGTWTRAELDNLTLRHTVGYYGGLVLGITIEITYSTGTGIDHYTYAYTVDGDATIAVVIGTVVSDKVFIKKNGSWTQSNNQYVKVSGTWRKVSKVWKKISGSWVLQSDKSALFSQDVNYINGGNL